jgi:hypothetical protein
MGVIQFLEYLHERAATSELAESVAQIFAMRNRMDLVPAEISRTAPRRVAS